MRAPGDPWGCAGNWLRLLSTWAAQACRRGSRPILDARPSGRAFPRVRQVRWKLCSESLHDAGSGSPGEKPQAQRLLSPDPARPTRSGAYANTYVFWGPAPGRGVSPLSRGPVRWQRHLLLAAGKYLCRHRGSSAFRYTRPRSRRNDLCGGPACVQAPLLQPGRYVPVIRACAGVRLRSKDAEDPALGLARGQDDARHRQPQCRRLCCIPAPPAR